MRCANVLTWELNRYGRQRRRTTTTDDGRRTTDDGRRTTDDWQHTLNLFFYRKKNKAWKGEIYFCKYRNSALIESPNNFLFSSCNTPTYQKRKNDTVSQRLDNKKILFWLTAHVHSWIVFMCLYFLCPFSKLFFRKQR